MKKTRLLMAWLLLAAPMAFAQTYYLENLKVENRHVAKEGRTVKVTMDVNMNDLDMKNQHSLRLVPTLVSADGTQELELDPILVNGKIRGKVMDRQETLGDLDRENQDVPRVRRKNGKEQTVHYEAETFFSPWMVNGRLDLRGYVTGCTSCDEGDETLATGDVLPYEEPQFLMPPVAQPKEETVKRRFEVQTARLQYRQDSHKVLPKYKNNQAELDKVQASIDAVKENKDLTITGIYVTGYASPEGTVAYNLKLSERRAKTFTDYVKKQNPNLDASLWHVDWKGEDWTGLREEVQKHPRLLKIDEVLAIIDGCEGDQDACEEKIKALVPPTIYQRLLNEMYGPLRRNDYRIEYNVRNFNLEEARQLIRTNPKLLSQNEMYQVAGSYPKDSKEYREAMEIAARTYPDDPVALGNAAATCLAAKDARGAIALLEGKKLDAAAMNTLGVAYAEAGEYEKAKSTLEEAARAGNADAKENLKQVIKVIEQL